MAQSTMQEVPTQVLAQCQDILRRHCATSPHTQFVCLGSIDGHLLCMVGASERDDGERVAALSSSLYGLSETMSRETVRDPARYNLVATDRGSLVLVRVPSPSSRFVLSLCADQVETMALALRNALDVADATAAVLP